MAIALVQSVKKVITGVNSTTLAYTSNVTSGNLLITSVASWRGTTNTLSTPTDTRSNTYSAVTAEQAITSGADFIRSRTWYAANTSGGANTVTVGYTNAGNGDITLVISEWSGALTSSPLDLTNTATGNSTTASAGATGTLSQADEMIYASLAYQGTNTTIAEDTTDSFSLLQENEGGSSDMPIATQYRIVSATTSLTPNWTLGAARNYIGHVGTFKAASGTTTVTKSLAQTWNVNANVTKSLNETWNVNAFITKSLAQSWVVNVFVTKSINETWNITAFVVKSLAQSWGIGGFVAKSYASDWKINATLTKNFDQTWLISQFVTKMLQVTWPISAFITKSYASSWGVGGTVVKPYTNTWNVNTSLTKSYASSWNINITATKSYDSTWGVSGVVTKSYLSTWQVDSGNIVITKSINFTWAVASNLTGSVADQEFARLSGLGYTGSVLEMRRKWFLDQLVIADEDKYSTQDLEFLYLRGLGLTGSLADMRQQHGDIDFD